MHYEKFEMQRYLSTDDENISNYDRKVIFQLRTRMFWGAKTNFRKMHNNLMCDACSIHECTQKHLLECNKLIGGNQLVTYLPRYEDIFECDEDEQCYIGRIMNDNLIRRKSMTHSEV